jgi:site-specific DNA recombinase
MKAAIYSRFSTDRQNESSIADQVRVCSEYAQRQGWQIVERYSDAGISGAAMGNRPGFLRMRADGMAGRFTVLLVTDTSRLARSQELAPLIERFRYQGVRVVGVQDSFDSASGTADMQAGLSGIMSVEFRRMVKARTYSALESRARDRKATGGRAYGYRDGQVDRGEALIVREIFGRFADGASTRTIAAELNGRHILSPGSSWKRETRRASGWMGSGVRAILLNERYRGVVHWNVSEWRKDPDTGKRQRIVRPRSEWISHTDEALRIISDDLYERAQRRFRGPTGKPARSGGGGKGRGPRYLLSGLLRCGECGAYYIGVNGREYGCSSHRDGGNCSNAVRVRRKSLEDLLLGDLRRDMLAPDVVRAMGDEIEREYVAWVKSGHAQADQVPREVLEISARIDRLRERLKAGDPDLDADELQGAIESAERKRRDLQNAQPAAKASARVRAMLPKAAKLYTRQIDLGLAGDEREALKARVFLREAFGGEIRLEADAAGGLTAHWMQQSACLMTAAMGCRPSGSGGRI